MTHLGQRLSALIDGELDLDERDRVLMHMARCGSCRDEVAALRMLKRRMNALGEAAAGAGLTGRLISLRDAGIGTPNSPCNIFQASCKCSGHLVSKLKLSSLAREAGGFRAKGTTRARLRMTPRLGPFDEKNLRIR